MGEAKSQVYLLVERYDRMLNDGVLKRIHQEDFCQALGFMSGFKYENDYGPGFQKCFELIDSLTLAAKDETTFLKYLIFNYLMGNADAHAKNYSVIHNNGGHYLAPLYDTVATTAFPDLSNKMAMSIGGEFEFLEVKRTNWERFATDLTLNYKQIMKELIRQAKALPKFAAQERQALKAGPFDVPSLDRTVAIIGTICEHALSIAT
jgi:serine/threonine-protein kinase HipA